MQNSRDSSVWRSLAVAFGDGLAFGVGMKLSQNAGRTAGAPPPADAAPLAERLEMLESRLAQVEQAPKALAPAAAPAPAPFDQKVLEAVVNALDARLQEHAGKVERRISELEARLALDLKALQQQDHALATTMQQRLEELHEQVGREVSAVRTTVAQQQHSGEAERRISELEVKVANDLQALRHQDDSVSTLMQARIGELHEQFSGQLTAIRDIVAAEGLALQEQMAELQKEIAAAVEGAVERQVAAGIDARIGPLEMETRQSVEARVQEEVAPMRGQIQKSEQMLVEVLQGVGQLCRDAAERMAGPPAPPQPVPVDEPPAPPPDPAPPEVKPPSFGQSQSSQLWRVPLVSSIFLTTGGLLLLRFLQ